MRFLALFLVLLGSWLGLALTQSKHIEVQKNQGDPVTIEFLGLPTDLTMFDGVTLEGAASIGGPYIDLATSIQKADKSITFPAPASPTFYRLYYWRLVSGSKHKSLSSNAIAVFIVSTGLPTS